jgi:hypothetical protein
MNQDFPHPPFPDFSDFPSIDEVIPPAQKRVFGLNYEALETRWNVNRRTLYRWKKLGVNLNSPQQVAAHISNQKNSSPLAIEAAIQTLQKS